MKIKIQALVIVMFMTLTGFVARQACNSIHFQKGATFEMDHFWKSKKNGTTKYVVKDVSKSGNTQEALIHTESYKEGSKKEGEADVKFICEGNKIKFDMKDMITASGSEQPSNFEIKMEEAYIEIPENPTVGQTLPDNVMNMKVIDKKSGQEMGTMKMTFANRKIVGKEKVTTPAGTFDCWKVTEDIKKEMSMMGMVRPIPATKSANYFNSDFGPVKSESYNEKGELMGYSVLTKYNKP